VSTPEVQVREAGDAVPPTQLSPSDTEEEGATDGRTERESTLPVDALAGMPATMKLPDDGVNNVKTWSGGG
jgi:hypothetical protein